MRLTGASLSGVTRTFLRWWGEELRLLVPEPLRAFAARLRRTLELHIAHDALRVTLRRGDRRDELGEVPLLNDDPRTAGRALADLLRERRSGYDRLVLLVPAHRALRRATRLPLAARDNLSEAIGYDIDRQTPFGEDEVYYGCRESAVDHAAGWVEAELEVVRRGDVDPALDALRVAGLEPDRLAVADGRGPDLRPPEWRGKSGGFLTHATVFMGIVAICLGAVLAYLPLYHMKAELAAIERHVAAARRAAIEVQSLRQDLSALRAREEQLAARKRDDPMALALLAELTRALPRDSFAIKMGYDAQEIALTGFSGKASALIGRLESLRHLEGVRFASPVTQDTRLNAERFNLEAKVKAAGDDRQDDGAATGAAGTDGVEGEDS